MAEDEVLTTVASQVKEFESLTALITSSISMQIAVTVLIIGLIGITAGYRGFANWTRKQKMNYTRPFVARFIRVAVLPLFAIALVSSINFYIQTFELFTDEEFDSASDVFAKVLNTINILVVGYTVAHLIPLAIRKYEKKKELENDFEVWVEMRGFKDDPKDLFHQLFKWVPPKHPPKEMSEEEFQEKLKTEKGREYLESFHTSKGYAIGSFQKLVDDPYKIWKKHEMEKYEKYYQACVSGNNESGKPLRPGQKPEEIYSIDIWREERRDSSYDPIIPGYRPPGYGAKKRKDLPKSVSQILPIAIFAAIVLGVVSWWGVDLFVLATATGGLAIGVGLALQETMQNWFAYLMIRKDKIIIEGDRVELDTGYNGYIHKITARVTFVRNAFNESFATIPTRNLVNSQIINFSKEIKMVPAAVNVGVSYLNNPKQVASILVKVGQRAMKESIDSKGKHLVVQRKCPYLLENKSSCGCDKGITVDIDQPLVRFNAFNDSALDFTIYLYVRDYGSQFKVETDIRMIMYEEFKKYDIRIPWPIRTIYQGDEKREESEINQLEAERKKVIERYGIGDIAGSEED